MGWLRDLAMGLRLSIGGSKASKTGVARLLMSTVGIGLAVFVLLLAVAMPHMLAAHHARQTADFANSQPIAGVAPTKVVASGTYVRGDRVRMLYVQGTGPDSPVPPGIDHLPAPGEVMVSPGLADLLAGPDAAVFLPRLPGKVVGTIDELAIRIPGDYALYAGADLSAEPAGDMSSVQEAYRFGFQGQEDETDPRVLTIVTIGVVVLLMPVLVFVAVSSRIAGAERDRRLAALRLVGADRRQVTRIAAAESLAGAGTGIVVGLGLFWLFRAYIENFRLQELGFYREDVAPTWWSVLLVLLAVPAISMGASLFSLRRTVIEPLGVVRRAPKLKRRLWWRLIAPALGVTLMLTLDQDSPFGLATGAVLLLFGIPLVLPWVLDRGLRGFRGGTPSVQLAVRRLQLDTGTATRVVAGLSVVLAGAIAIQGLLAAEAKELDVSLTAELGQTVPDVLRIMPDEDSADQALLLTKGVSGVRNVVRSQQFGVRTPNQGYYSVLVLDCATIRRILRVSECSNGDAFRSPQDEYGPIVNGTVSDRDDGNIPWQVPANVQVAAHKPADPADPVTDWHPGLVVTPAVLGDLPVQLHSEISAQLEPGSPDVQDRVRNALAPLRWKVYVYQVSSNNYSDDQASFLVVRNGLLGGSIFTLLLAGACLLVVALEQMRERRRAIAALSATGVPTSTLAKSILIQTAVPMAAGVLVAVITGIGLSALVFPLMHTGFAVDWGVVGILSGAAALLVVAVTALTLPSLRGAARLEALRSE